MRGVEDEAADLEEDERRSRSAATTTEAVDPTASLRRRPSAAPSISHGHSGDVRGHAAASTSEDARRCESWSGLYQGADWSSCFSWRTLF